MYCKKCGVQNPDDAKFCISCGEQLEVDKEENTMDFIKKEMVDLSIIRKSVKAKAKSSTKSPLIITLVLMILLALLGVFVSISNIEVGSFYILLFTIFLLFVLFGMVKASLNISRGEQIEFMDVIKNSFKNPSCFFKYFLIAIIFNFILGMLTVIPLFGFIIAIVAEIYLTPVLVMYMYKAADPKTEDKSISGMVKSSMELVKGHRVEFYGLMISFFGWILLSFITLGIALLWVIPYVSISFANFYRYLNKEEKYIDAEKGLSNGIIIALGILGYIAFIVIIVITIIIIIVVGIVTSDTSENDDNYEWNWSTSEDYYIG